MSIWTPEANQEMLRTLKERGVSIDPDAFKVGLLPHDDIAVYVGFSVNDTSSIFSSVAAFTLVFHVEIAAYLYARISTTKEFNDLVYKSHLLVSSLVHIN
jgi:hypothetical protein